MSQQSNIRKETYKGFEYTSQYDHKTNTWLCRVQYNRYLPPYDLTSSPVAVRVIAPTVFQAEQAIFGVIDRLLIGNPKVFVIPEALTHDSKA